MNINLKGYRTYIAAGLTGVFGALATLDWVSVLSGNVPAGVTAIVIAVLMAVMRSITNTPPAQPDTPKPGDFGYIPEKEEKK